MHIVNNSKNQAGNTYDSFGRTSKLTTKKSGTAVKTDAFTFKSPTDTTTSSQITKHTITAGGTSKSYSYTYDKNGNILSVSDGTKTTTYVYDSANQLIRENNQAGNFTHVWTYDDGGNILTRKEYAYTTGTLGTVKDTVNYTYESETWGDLLTNYDGNRASRDLIGNAVRLGDKTYTWEHGRQMATVSVDSDFVILSQPEDFTGRLGDTVTFSVAARGTGLTYRWQVSVDAGSTWYDSTATWQRSVLCSGLGVQCLISSPGIRFNAMGFVLMLYENVYRPLPPIPIDLGDGLGKGVMLRI